MQLTQLGDCEHRRLDLLPRQPKLLQQWGQRFAQPCDCHILEGLQIHGVVFRLLFVVAAHKFLADCSHTFKYLSANPRTKLQDVLLVHQPLHLAAFQADAQSLDLPFLTPRR